MMALRGGSEFVAHVGEKDAFRSIGGFGGFFSPAEFFGTQAFGDVAGHD